MWCSFLFYGLIVYEVLRSDRTYLYLFNILVYKGLFKFSIEFDFTRFRAYFFSVVLNHNLKFLMVYLLFLSSLESFVEGLFTNPKTSIEPLSFKRFFLFSSISFANVLGNELTTKKWYNGIICCIYITCWIIWMPKL